MKREKPIEIPVKVVVIECDDGLVFDLIDSQHYIKRFNLDSYQRRQMRGTDRQVMQQLIEEYVNESVPNGTDYTLRIFFC